MTISDAPRTDAPPEAAPRLTLLPNGARVVVVPLAGRETVAVSVFVRTGSQHESRSDSGISHVVEHMAFKGTASRDCQRINLDAELLGAEVNAHTDRDHTAFHIDGLAADAGAFVRMLGDIVLNSDFPEAELERERQVILHELAEDDDDPLTTAFKLFDQACWGDHPVARPVIGLRANIQRFRSDDLRAFVRRQYTAANVVIGVAGPVDADAIVADAAASFGAMPAGQPNLVAPPEWVGGFKAKSLAGSSQTHLVLGYPIPALADEPVAQTLAAAVLGEGMSSPLLDQIRERRGLAYYLACSADVRELCGQFVIEASTGPGQADELLGEMLRLLAEQAERIDPVALERARRQLIVRSLRADERASRRLEAAAMDLYTHGELRSGAQWRERIAASSAAQVQQAFVEMRRAPPALAVSGQVGRGLRDALATRLRAGSPGSPGAPTAATRTSRLRYAGRFSSRVPRP